MNRHPLITAALVSAALAFIAGAVWIFANTRWDAPLAPSENHVSVGPFGPGESFGQALEPPAAFTSWLRVTVHGAEGSAPARSFQLLMRLREGERLIREGVIQVDNLDSSLRELTWTFEPLQGPRENRLNLEVAVGETGPPQVFTFASILDLLPGSLITNGEAAEEHMDLAVAAGRSIARSLIMRAVGGAFPGGLPAFAAAALAVGIAAGAGLGALQFRALRRVEWASWMLLGASIALMLLAIVVKIASNDLSPEHGSDFWGRLVILATILVGTPWALWAPQALGRWSAAGNQWALKPAWLVSPLSRTQDRASRPSKSGRPGMRLLAATQLRVHGLVQRLGPDRLALASAALLSIVALGALPFTESERITLTRLPDGRPEQGRIPVLPSELMEATGRAAMIALLVFAALALTRNLYARSRERMRQ